MRNPIRRVRPEKTGVRAPLGDLETAVMQHLWECGPEGCLAADVQRALDSQRPVAVTTVLTTLDRLVKKGIVRREQDGRPFRFYAAVSEADLEQRIVEGVLEGLIAQFPRAVAAYFAQRSGEAASRSDPEAALIELAAQVEAIRDDLSTGTLNRNDPTERVD